MFGVYVVRDNPDTPFRSDIGLVDDVDGVVGKTQLFAVIIHLGVQEAVGGRQKLKFVILNIGCQPLFRERMQGIF